MFATVKGAGEFSLVEDLGAKELLVNVRSLSDISGDGLALLGRQLEMGGAKDSTVKICISQNPKASSIEELNLGSVAQVCERSGPKVLMLRTIDTGTESAIRLVR